LGAICFLGGRFFHKIKGRETTITQDLNTTQDITGLTECLSTECEQEFKIFVFEISFDFYVFVY
jgi:hypothetical protein